MRLCFALVAVVGLGVVPVAEAELYKWVGEDGKVHFSDKPPVAPGAQVEEIGPEPGVPSAYGGRGNSRRLEISEVRIELGLPPDTVVGDCATGKPVRAKSLRSGAYGIEGARLKSAAYEELEKLGFATPPDAKDRFGGERPPDIDVRVEAKIVQVELADCNRRVTLTVDWSFYDSERGKSVLKFSTTGHDLDEKTGIPSRLYALRRSFADSARNLSADRRFVALMTPGGDLAGAVRAAKTPAAIGSAVGGQRLRRIRMPLNYAPQRGELARRVRGLRSASATIRSAVGDGSGCLISDAGYILTNSQVVGDARRVLVSFEDKEMRARVVRIDPERDLALLTLQEPAGRAPLAIRRKVPAAGEEIYMVTTPLDRSSPASLRRGVLARGREVHGVALFRSDAKPEAGFAGGAVVDEFGAVIGLRVSPGAAGAKRASNETWVIPIGAALDALSVDAR